MSSNADVFDPTEAYPISFDRLRQIRDALGGDTSAGAAAMGWIQPILARKAKYDRILGERREFLEASEGEEVIHPRDFYFAVRHNESAQRDEYEIFLCDRSQWALLDRFPWETPPGISQIFPGPELGEFIDTDSGMWWYRGDMAKARGILTAKGFTENPLILKSLW